MPFKSTTVILFLKTEGEKALTFSSAEKHLTAYLLDSSLSIFFSYFSSVFYFLLYYFLACCSQERKESKMS